MFSTWFLHMVVFSLLVRGNISEKQCTYNEVKPGKDSAVMDSLQCYNDYNAKVQCTWEADTHANFSLNQLVFWDNEIKKETVCVLNKPSVLLSNGKISHACGYETKRFSSGTEHVLYFNVPCEPTVTSLRVAQHGKVRAPVDLTEKAADGGGHLLSWKSPYHASSNITRSLVYQLQYRRYMDDWTTVDNISVSEHAIGKESLIPGYHYEARVRARGPVGLWSDWSSLVSWKTHNGVNGIFNLQCVIAGETTVTCTWQMKTEYFPFMSYNIWCSDGNNTDPYACCETPQLQSSNDEQSEFMCSITTTDPNLLTVELRPVRYSRIFDTLEHIKLPQPDQVRVTEGSDDFQLNWSYPKVKSDFNFNAMLKLSTKEGFMNFTFPETISYVVISSDELQPSSEYQVQLKLVPTENEYYEVKESEWSELTVFTTKPVLPSVSPMPSVSPIIYILAGVFVPVLIAILYTTLPACHRRIAVWKGSIPSPIKSKVLEGMIKKYPAEWPYVHSEKEATSVCVLLTTDNIAICNSNSINWELIKLHTEDTVKMGESGGSNPLHTSVGESICKDKSGMSFSGPYILCCEDSCTQDKMSVGSTDTDHTCVSEKSENFIQAKGGYVVTAPTAMPATQSPTPVDSPSTEPSDECPAYTPSPDPSCTVITHPSGYFVMPCVATGQPQPRGYVTLSHNEPE